MTTVRSGHAGFFPEMGGAGMIWGSGYACFPFWGYGVISPFPLHSGNVQPLCGRVMPVFSQKWAEPA
uniref:Uncharacterized protein n=1 Tax=Meloidogyne enterolobii TaxID=390850 RepID=A0A6V7W3A0_MELEN|nr:unnamed protein product [Meloidogyne enterolobii]